MCYSEGKIKEVKIKAANERGIRSLNVKKRVAAITLWGKLSAESKRVIKAMRVCYTLPIMLKTG